MTSPDGGSVFLTPFFYHLPSAYKIWACSISCLLFNGLITGELVTWENGGVGGGGRRGEGGDRGI